MLAGITSRHGTQPSHTGLWAACAAVPGTGAAALVASALVAAALVAAAETVDGLAVGSVHAVRGAGR
jgi:hypothetical protein